MRPTIIALIGGALGLWSAPLFAHDTEDAEAPPPPPPDWSVGVGVGLGGFAIGTPSGGPSGGLGGLAGLGALPWFYASTLERRIARGTWLTLTGRGGYTSAHDAYGDVSSWSVGGDLGVRQVINPDDSFQVSFHGSAGPSYASSRGYLPVYDGETFIDMVDTRSVAWDLHAQVGLALDQAFTDHIGMRLSASFLRAAYSVQRGSGGDAHGFSASLGVSPQLEIRFQW